MTFLSNQRVPLFMKIREESCRVFRLPCSSHTRKREREVTHEVQCNTVSSLKSRRKRLMIRIKNDFFASTGRWQSSSCLLYFCLSILWNKCYVIDLNTRFILSFVHLVRWEGKQKEGRRSKKQTRIKNSSKLITHSFPVVVVLSLSLFVWVIVSYEFFLSTEYIIWRRLFIFSLRVTEYVTLNNRIRWDS